MSATLQEQKSTVRFIPRHDTAPNPAEQVLGFVVNAMASRCAYLMAKLAIADHLNDGPRSAGQLAELTKTHAPSLYRLLRAAASVGLVTEDDAGRFSLTPAGQLLRSDVAGTLRWTLMSELSPDFNTAWNEALYSVQTGKIAAEKAWGSPVWEYFGKNREAGEIFNRSMTGFTEAIEPSVMKAYDFAGIKKLVDVGGGHGSFLTTILRQNPTMHGIVFDLPQVVEGAKLRIRDAGLADRCTTAGGSFFETIPAVADAVVMKFILHDWNDEQSTKILRSCHTALKPGGKVILVESVIPPGNDPFIGKLMDVHMMVMCGGRERTEAEWKSLLAGAGFSLTKIVPTESGVSVIEAARS